MAKVICSKHGDVSQVSLIFTKIKGYEHPKKFQGKGICFYCLAENLPKLALVKGD